ncbi:unnamed protein product [Medioppia subpectinata]|uniref:RING-type domain-containing protein n=1 Tax=Medioppia subpectinata TaxID=1979941 RepID=A0A7R9KWE8_9ACAR|nr:unnamed protein product [Medioppia subpectinata]CAG2111108.1 unnamed protein product [Medioppia subpectinata]
MTMSVESVDISAIDINVNENVDSYEWIPQLKKILEMFNKLTDKSCSWANDFFALMKSEGTRLRTFSDQILPTWACVDVSPESLANAGFFRLTESKVQCAFCRGIIDNWEPGSRTPLYVHALVFYMCPFIMEMDVGNVPLGLDPIRNQPSIPCCGGCQIVNSINENYKTYEQRLASFASHEHLFSPNVRQFAEAGLYYKGPGDRVKCFRCTGTMSRFAKNDDPWAHHAGAFPSCKFVREIKSSEFINESIIIVEELKAKWFAISTWMRSNFALELIDLKLQSKDRVLEVMSDRWDQQRLPFTSACDAKFGILELTSENSLLCKICFENELCVVLLPCCHTATCVTCAQKLDNCPICRHTVQTTLHTFYS